MKKEWKWRFNIASDAISFGAYAFDEHRSVGIHLCGFWGYDKQFDPPKRLYLEFWPLGSLSIGARSQKWTWRNGYRTDPQKWTRFAYQPPKWLECRYRDEDGRRCAASRWHRGEHFGTGLKQYE